MKPSPRLDALRAMREAHFAKAPKATPPKVKRAKARQTGTKRDKASA